MLQWTGSNQSEFDEFLPTCGQGLSQFNTFRSSVTTTVNGNVLEIDHSVGYHEVQLNQWVAEWKADEFINPSHPLNFIDDDIKNYRSAEVHP